MPVASSSGTRYAHDRGEECKKEHQRVCGWEEAQLAPSESGLSLELPSHQLSLEDEDQMRAGFNHIAVTKTRGKDLRTSNRGK